MDFGRSDAQQAVHELSGKILGEQISDASLRELDGTGTFMHERAFRQLAQAGLLSVTIEEDHGGMGEGLLALTALLEQVGAHVAPVPVLALSLGTLPVQRFGNDEQKGRLLPRIAAGELCVSAALHEPGNDDLTAPLTRAETDGTGFRVSGSKICVPLAHEAMRVVVPAQTQRGPCLLLVDPVAQGVTRTRNTATHGEPIFRLDLDDVAVAAADVLAPPGDGAALQWLRDAATVAVCAVEVGVTSKALAITAQYTAERHQFGRPIGSFQAVRQRAADAYIDVDNIRLATLQAAWLLDEGRDASMAASVAKWMACEGGYRVTYAAQHLHGGMGYDTDYPLHRYYLWSKAMELSLGSAPQQLLRLGKMIAERPVHIGD